MSVRLAPLCLVVAAGDDGTRSSRVARHLVVGFPAVQGLELLLRRLFAHLRIVGPFVAPAKRTEMHVTLK